MKPPSFKLLTAIEVEKTFGKKFFYRQKTYRLADSGKLTKFNSKGKLCFLGTLVIKAFLNDLELQIKSKFPGMDTDSLQIFYDVVKEKRIVVDGVFGKSLSINTNTETQDDLLKKIGAIIEWLNGEELDEKEKTDQETQELQPKRKKTHVVESLPEEILWIRVDTGIIKKVKVKSFILISLPSVAQFMGIRNDQFIEWLANTTFSSFVLSAHPKQIYETEISVSWKRGIHRGLVPLIPFEILPEIIVAFRQSGRSLQYPEKANLLYELSKTTLESVGLAISGNKARAAEELASVGQGLGITVAEQIIGIFKQYETRDYQIETTKQFNSKVKKVRADFAATIGNLTLGITGRGTGQWKALGVSKNLPKKITDSSREIMREISPSDSVGMTFGEKHYIQDPKVAEAIQTGKQGKQFYERLKSVGLLE